jgi:cytidine deaminase
MNDLALLTIARSVRQHAYAPYSDFAVGAALLGEDGRVYTGSNVENSIYPAGCCAERVALYTAVSAGARKFEALALTGWQRDLEGGAYLPCGICRQALYEFAPNLKIITGRLDDLRVFKLDELLPHSFIM